LPDTCLRYIREKQDKTREVLKGGNDTNELIAQSLGVLPDNSIKIFIGVEGPNDIAFLKHLSKTLITAGVEVLNLEKMELGGELIFFPLGGSSLAHWISRLENLNRPEFHLFDRDNQPPADPKYKTEAESISQREKCKALHTGKKELENYLHFKSINEAYTQNGITLGLSMNFSDFDNVPVEVAKKVHAASDSTQTWEKLNEGVRKKKISQAKTNLNNVAASFMTKERLNEVDPDGHVLNWFQEMKILAND